ncbi:MAG: nucleotidyltransferase domain-containing protein [Chitinophagales bacterium]
MNGILEQIKKTLAAHLPDLQKRYPIERLALFGSLTRDDFEEGKSDVDILVELNGDMDWNYFDLVWELNKLFPELKVDVVSQNAIQPHYWEYIEEDLQYV